MTDAHYHDKFRGIKRPPINISTCRGTTAHSCLCTGPMAHFDTGSFTASERMGFILMSLTTVSIVATLKHMTNNHPLDRFLHANSESSWLRHPRIKTPPPPTPPSTSSDNSICLWSAWCTSPQSSNSHTTWCAIQPQCVAVVKTLYCNVRSSELDRPACPLTQFKRWQALWQISSNSLLHARGDLWSF